MSKHLEEYFKQKKGQFDLAEPNVGHFERFQAKLSGTDAEETGSKGRSPWYLLAIAASILLVFGYWLGNMNASNGLELADVSPKMEETQNFYAASIQKEMEIIEGKRNDLNAHYIDAALQQLEKLESDYQKLTLELKESDEDKRVIYAMISNFQTRLMVLQNLMDQLEELEIMVPQENNVS